MVINTVFKANTNLLPEEKKAVAGIFNAQYYQLAYLNGSSYVLSLILRLFEDMGILRMLKDKPRSCEELIADFGLSPKTKYALEWLLLFLCQSAYLNKTQAQGIAYYRYEGLAKAIDPELLFEETVRQDKGIAPSARLMEYVLSEYPAFLKGQKSGFEILFSGDKMQLWNEYFSNDNSGYSVNNSLGAVGMLKWAFKKDSIRVLEIGGGTGSATAALLDRLKENNLTNRIGEYIFSDVSPVFLRMGNRRIMDSAPDDLKYELKRLDFDKPLVLQGIKGNDIDAVYGVNTLHVAKNLSQALKNIHQVIKSGGMLVISECCRPHKDYLLFQEVIFNLLDNYVSVELDSNLRPVSGFLDYDHWKASLLDAGFRNVEAIFNTDADFPQGLKDKIGILVAVIKAEK